MRISTVWPEPAAVVRSGRVTPRFRAESADKNPPAKPKVTIDPPEPAIMSNKRLGVFIGVYLLTAHTAHALFDLTVGPLITLGMAAGTAWTVFAHRRDKREYRQKLEKLQAEAHKE